jgi:hypothetical protein
MLGVRTLVSLSPISGKRQFGVVADLESMSFGLSKAGE